MTHKTNPQNLLLADNLPVLKALPDNLFTACVTDPPYGLKFMGKKWDYDVPSVETWTEVLRILKPGAHLLCFCGTRTFHRMVVNLEDAGFEIRDTLVWAYGSGWPKSLNISKGIDKKFGAEKEALLYNGYGTALKPAVELMIKAQKHLTVIPDIELISLCRKPISEKTIVENVLKWGTGGIWVDGGRVGTRFPANLIHDGSEEVLGFFPHTKSGALLPHHVQKESANNCMSGKNYARTGRNFPASEGSAARFFYQAKASKSERNEGLDELPKRNNHSTVKPVALLRHLVRLVSIPQDNYILDPYAGTGTTALACEAEGIVQYLMIEQNSEYFEIMKRREYTP